MLYIYYIKDFLKLTVSSLSVSLSSQERLKNDDSNKYLDPKRENIWKKRSNRKPGWRHYPPATGPSAPWACCHVDLSCSTWSLLFSQGQESQWGKESLRQCHDIIIIFFVLATLYSIWDFSSVTRDGICAQAWSLNHEIIISYAIHAWARDCSL